jgi:hypothetical protein
MSEPFAVTPSELRATSKLLSDASTSLKDVLSTLRANLRAEGAPWGEDDIGEQFAKDFLPQLKWVDESVGAKSGLLDDYSDLLRGAADRFEGADGG